MRTMKIRGQLGTVGTLREDGVFVIEQPSFSDGAVMMPAETFNKLEDGTLTCYEIPCSKIRITLSGKSYEVTPQLWKAEGKVVELDDDFPNIALPLEKWQPLTQPSQPPKLSFKQILEELKVDAL